MCTYTISLNDSLVETIRPAFRDEMALEQWLQRQMDTIIIEFATKQQVVPKRRQQPLSQRLRGIAKAPENFDYKEELATRNDV